MQKITPFLWYDGHLEEVVKFYTSVFKSSKVEHIDINSAIIELEGQTLFLLNGGPGHPFTDAVSLFISCDRQEEIDYYWEKLIADGGKESRCGWLKDKFGLSWQVVPSVLQTLVWDKNRAKADAAMKAMLTMNKLDIKTLQEAYGNA